MAKLGTSTAYHLEHDLGTPIPWITCFDLNGSTIFINGINFCTKKHNLIPNFHGVNVLNGSSVLWPLYPSYCLLSHISQTGNQYPIDPLFSSSSLQQVGPRSTRYNERFICSFCCQHFKSRSTKAKVNFSQIKSTLYLYLYSIQQKAGKNFVRVL